MKKRLSKKRLRKKSLRKKRLSKKSMNKRLRNKRFMKRGGSNGNNNQQKRDKIAASLIQERYQKIDMIRKILADNKLKNKLESKQNSNSEMRSYVLHKDDYDFAETFIDPATFPGDKKKKTKIPTVENLDKYDSDREVLGDVVDSYFAVKDLIEGNKYSFEKEKEKLKAILQQFQNENKEEREKFFKIKNKKL